ncbi:DUF2169 family type VI secretion system accessory protein [Polyangium aurulentum]|uniref:DUF2169 family type VI secretion system accessory protein n=1 Tax=Polyangium aurulentum TaxID=2567896 RepID=UPI0010AE2DB2|nr:DUF2169 domain-containing protein [Polyangium aurulentum]UQA63242.1 DUF2169 domain-containing protein [Polyangium aurulentum]
MDVASFGPLRVSSMLWQPRPGAHALTVICKATFELRPGSSPLAPEQEAPYERDIHRDDDPGRSLRTATDLVPFKRRADVLVLGHARPPRGVPAPTFVARVVVGMLEKTVEVRADRAWAAMDLGPIAPTWPARTALLGRHAATWDHLAWNTRPVPEDVDGAFFNVAPVDQQLTELTGEERIVLEHLHPHHAKLETRLARVVPKASVKREKAALQEVRLRCDTLTIDADRGLAMLVWRGVVVLAHPAERGVVAVTAQGVDGDTEGNLTATQPSQDTVSVQVLPFGQCAVGRGGAKTDVAEARDAVGSNAASREADDVGTTTIKLHASVNTKPVLPFIPGGSGASSSAKNEEQAPAPPRRADEEEAGTGTMVSWYAGVATVLKPVLPFQHETNPAQARGANQATPAVESALETEPSQETCTGPEPITYAPYDVPPPAMISKLVPATAAEKPPAPAALLVEKPSMLMPLARTDAEVATGKLPEADKQPTAEETPVEPEPTSVELTIEQCATIAAEIDEGRGTHAKVLEAHGLDEQAWRTNDRRWKGAIEEEVGQGRQVLRDAYDAAYVARVEGFRGAILLEEYARLLVGLERGRVNAALDALRIHRAALMPIVRVWTRKVATDMKITDKAQIAIRAARRLERK